MQTLPFQVSEDRVVGADGTASISIGPTSYKETWKTSIVAVANTPVPPAVELTDIPTAQIFLGPASMSNFIGGTFTGNQDSDTSMNVTVPTGSYLTAVWTGADPGSTVFLAITGIKEIG